MPVQAKPRIVVVGGGFGGLETAFMLRWRLGARVDLTLISDRDHFLFRPGTLQIPFGLDPKRLAMPLARPLRRRRIGFVHGTARDLDPVNQTIHVAGRALRYTYLVLATGAGMRPGEIPGLAQYAEMI